MNKVSAVFFKVIGEVYNQIIDFLFPNKPFFNNSDFDITKELEKHFIEIRKEFTKVKAQHRLQSMEKIFVEQSKLIDENSWNVYVLKSFSFIHQDQLVDLAFTRKVIQNKDISSAFFSVLAPQKRIAPHRGPFKGVIRIFLPLIVPQNKENCYIVVGGSKQFFEEGKCLVFDDYYEHYVINDTDEPRVVLFIDYIRPLPFPINFVNRMALMAISKSPFIKALRDNVGKY